MGLGAHHGACTGLGETVGHELDARGCEDLEAPGAEPVPEGELNTAHPRWHRVAVAPEGHTRLVVDDLVLLDGCRVGNRRQGHQHLGVGQLTDTRPLRAALLLLGQLARVEVAPGRTQAGIPGARPEPVHAHLGVSHGGGRHGPPPAPAAELHPHSTAPLRFPSWADTVSRWLRSAWPPERSWPGRLRCRAR